MERTQVREQCGREAVMIVTFPHMGYTYICIKALLDDLNVCYVIPPFNNKKGLEIGTKYSPEMACLPLKINIGNYIQAFEKGADTILMAGGCGPCRFGYYCEMQREILKDMGYDIQIITLELPKGNVKEFINRIKKLTSGFDIIKIVRAVSNATQIAKSVDQLEHLSFKVRAREIHKGETEKIWKSFEKKVLSVKGSKDIFKIIKDTEEELNNIEIDQSVLPLKIGIVGEIYTSIDSFTSFFLQSRLGDMGVEVHRSVTLSDWIIEHIIKKSFGIKRNMRFAEEAKPYLGIMIGGHARETIGNTILYAKNGYDGVIQTYPLTCMPEIVAESILPSVERDFNIPILTLIIDEMTGETGYITRLEAFIDLLNKRREKEHFGRRKLLFGN
jgi:predicted nucleotide-binding protein (sugar kinase/HSP70/actin superfamily)